ncbi:MAG: lipoprotein insertase outer membrane protein LolB [Gammaproteobacteria bacterium]|nr:lipoprotein insertase outer membrane protein LolB [Gammaproteobacteria bacterium]
MPLHPTPETVLASIIPLPLLTIETAATPCDSRRMRSANEKLLSSESRRCQVGIFCLIIAGLLGACSSLAPPAPQNSEWSVLRQQLEAMQSWQLRGRVNVRYNNKSYTPRIQWQQNGLNFSLRLWGTFNTGNTIVKGSPDVVTLEQGDTVLHADSPEQLILEQLGYELPVSYLRYWVRGLPDPSSQAELEFNEMNQLVRLQQEDWIVTYADLRQYGTLSMPRRVEVIRPVDAVRLRFVGLSWNLDLDRE